MKRPGAVDRRVALLAPIHALGLLVPWSVAARASAQDAAGDITSLCAKQGAEWKDGELGFCSTLSPDMMENTIGNAYELI